MLKSMKEISKSGFKKPRISFRYWVWDLPNKSTKKSPPTLDQTSFSCFPKVLNFDSYQLGGKSCHRGSDTNWMEVCQTWGLVVWDSNRGTKNPNPFHRGISGIQTTGFGEEPPIYCTICWFLLPSEKNQKILRMFLPHTRRVLDSGRFHEASGWLDVFITSKLKCFHQ